MKRLSQEEVIKNFRKVQGNMWGYSKFIYVNNKTKGIMICRKHGEFEQTPNDHLKGHGCPKCSNSISRGEIQFLKYCKVPNKFTNRQVKIGKYKVDGIIKSRETIYEYLGTYWHGDPRKFKRNEIHSIIKIPYSELYNNTCKRFDNLIELTGFKINYVWEKDWKQPKIGNVNKLNIKTYKYGSKIL